MLEQVLRTIRRFGMIVPGQRIGVACSGGPDSTALLLILEELARDFGYTLSVTHFNHRLRGEESDQDEEFVRKLAERLELPFHGTARDVRACAQQARANLEETARRLRYGFFVSLIESGWADRVAVGHTADDQAETVLHRLLRGTGTRGLGGIYPVVEDRIIRPLIEARRRAVLEWLTTRQQPWREDSSNRDLRRMRNRIRHQLLPMLADFNPRIVETLADTAAIARDEEAFWKDYLDPILAQSLRREEGRVGVDIEHLRRMPRAVARRVLRSAIRVVAQPGSGQQPAGLARLSPRWGLSSGSADFDQVQRLLDLALEGQSGGTLSLPQKIVARKEFTHLLLEAAGAARARFEGFLYPVQAPAVVEVPEIGSSFAFELIPLDQEQARYNEVGVSLLDSRVAESPLILRNWQPGDAYRQKGHWKPRKLKELFQRQRISLRERQRWPVVVARDQIVWSRGLGIAEGFSPPPNSSEALRIREAALEMGGRD
ncbi:MAG: tRNA lysidine(34) synthetase TilS [Acidobacteria bacterium RIFCSPLOWO2_12_FULL_60_22]|nr:MAG: tRNA lysidine(34) synthetase TilS [Acidobacteria bacterium RIFCSPLOWO2_12_FULL_60_22]